jgi:multidrug efflux pump subunit AcrA (membrane-fusion protein)
MGLPLLIVAIAAGLWLAGTGNDRRAGGAEESRTLYTCGMHPQIIRDEPGNCPICGMKLTPMRRSGQAMQPGAVAGAGAEDTAIAIDPVTIQNMGIRTGVVALGPLRRLIRTVGTIDYSEPGLTDVTTKFGGWIEKLYVDATGSLVMRGDPLFEIYSPELYSAQTEYLLALGDGSRTNQPGRDAVLQSARLKLKFFDIADEQIAELERTREPSKTLRVSAPMDGFVIEKMVVEGMMTEAGMRLYRLADLGLVWVYAEVYEQDLPFIHLGQEALVSLSYLPDRQFRGRVTYIYPAVDEETRTARVRMEFHNPGYLLKPGMFASVELRAQLEDHAILVPGMAILRSGEKNTVFVALEGGRFEPREVAIGVRGENDMYQVLGGLKESERIVISGQFMLDSESQLREAVQKMLHPERFTEAHPPRGGERVEETATVTPAPDLSEAEPHVYVCPMPEHVSIEYQHPGDCPLCGMALVPVSAELLAKMQPGGKIEYYTCPMPEHLDVKVDRSGKCPRCGMTLIPVMPKPPVAGTRPERQAEAAPRPTLYTCPMEEHFDVVSDAQGRCSKCEMKLVPTGTVEHGPRSEAHWRREHGTPGGPALAPHFSH